MTDEYEDVIDSLFRDTRRNAGIGWVVVAVTCLVFFESLIDFDPQWILFSAAVVVAMLVPPVATRSRHVMLPWELLALTALPVAVRGVTPDVAVSAFAAYLSVAAFALLVVVELDVLTPMEVTHWFAVVLVVTATLASAGAWAIVRWILDRSLGTAYLSTNEALMGEFLSVTLAGIAAGVLFDRYFRHRDRKIRRELRRDSP